ncbi:MAG TPA: hypothetical protein PKE45_21025, partial [Caldilineaceae bacterium]|nr:hypothetical protein [Caldilineaceae bacterium]
MFTKRATSIALAVVTGLAPVVMATAPVFASTTQPANPAASTVQPGTSASTAIAPVSGWVQIAPHSSQWFKFKYNYDDSLKKENRDNTPQQAMVELTMQQPGSMGFDVWTPGRLQNPQYTHTDIHHRNGEITPVGVGTPMFED